MSRRGAEVVVCRAGIGGIAAADHSPPPPITWRRGVTGVVRVDERPPLLLTSDESTECYRDWWPGPGDAIVAATNRSIDIGRSVTASSRMYEVKHDGQTAMWCANLAWSSASDSGNGRQPCGEGGPRRSRSGDAPT